ncbi:Acid phosphatase [Parasponia andersonii]|uniref:Acid phosphatase n=1 Tax=Parasponia andersonii TaxID=3476 RepID=A0A2P5CN71_PARAD|nr:Acid phosphatase [Parasponia andersonii]
MAFVSGYGRFALTILLFFLGQIPNAFPQSIIQSWPRNQASNDHDDVLYCDSWRFSVETNDAGYWSKIPARCLSFVRDYMNGDRYRSDSEVVAGNSLAFARSVEIAGDGRDAWVFDIDETLLSNLPYYESHGFGSETFDEKSFDEWVDLAEAPALPASLSLYKELEQLGFKIFLLTGRSEFQRNVTEKNLAYAGYKNWERLLLRGPSDQRKPAIVYKSEKRSDLVNEGYTIHGNSGDQWSDLMGFAIAQRSFKLPNPMYYIA